MIPRNWRAWRKSKIQKVLPASNRRLPTLEQRLCFLRSTICAQFTYMKKITFRADEYLIDQARLVARIQGKTLNAAFCEWLVRFADPYKSVEEAKSLMSVYATSDQVEPSFGAK